MNTPKKKTLSLFSLVMINLIAIDSLKTLSTSAEYGLSLVFYFLLVALVFFIPMSLVAAELATGWPETGGIYVWAREAFGKKWGFFTMWLQWFNNILWFLTIMTFIGATLAYCINPNLVNNPVYMLIIVLVFFWGATIVNFFGLSASSLLCTIAAVVGTIVPMILISALAGIWMMMGKPICLHFDWHSFFPDLSNINNLVLLTAMFYGLTGIEMSAIHAGDVENPQRNYPKAIFWSVIIIVSTLIFSSLAIALVIPQQQINIVSGMLQAFEVFFATFHISWMMPVLALLIVLSSVGIANAWILGPSKGLLVACHDQCFSEKFGFQNKHAIPVTILLLQGAIFTILCAAFFLMPSVSSGFWLLTDIAAILQLMFYFMLFITAIKLRYKYPNVKRAFTIPGGKIGLWIICGSGCAACLFTIFIGFLPPTQIPVGNLTAYELLIVAGIVICCTIPFVLYYKNAKNRNAKVDLSLH